MGAHLIILSDVELVVIDCVYPKKTTKALYHCLQACSFASVKFFTSIPMGDFTVCGVPVNVVKIPHIDCLQKYSRFVIHDLHKHFDTEHVMIAQADGFILNPDAWQKEFLDFDYIGAPWWWYTDGYNVGNGGFCIRSKRLMKHLSDTYDETEARYGRDIFHPEDHYICRTMRKSLEDCSGFTFAPGEIAGKFSVENGRWNGQFGFHDFETDISAWPGFNAFNVNPSVKAGI